MKRWVSTLLAIILTLASVPFASAQEAEQFIDRGLNNPTTVTSAVYESQETTENFNPEDLITVSTLTEKFHVTREWVVREMIKGYGLHHIYQGLQLREQGGSYEDFIASKYPNLPPNPLLLAEQKMEEALSVTEQDYPSNTVTESVYNRNLSVTESTYDYRAKALLGEKNYDELALKKLPLTLDQAPYSVGAEEANISTIDGSLRIEVTDMIVTGVNGLDFELRRIYDSTRAKDNIFVKEGTYALSNETEKTFEESYFPIGNGWIWDISYMNKKNGQWYIYIAGVGTFMLSENMNLMGYPWRNLVFGETSDIVEVSGARAIYELTDIQNGRKQYFDRDGKLIQIRDRLGNKIK
ncbi:hypothetical protein [Paenibacillus thiaminolyticus]|uniref:Uncharacterized protein n=1 Tax=Paenibacillus thiaminolyticus TaxID=49283 RepID=A0A3A3GQE4_PANTH|nr:hypothetical protein [Paenibacillus thiaminolyticus]RJG26622.1 hypothetical protein DQX05_00875 [Paenibacillus thiaminolyticus]